MVILAGCIALALAACGRRGPLEPPPGATNAVPLPEDQATDTINASPVAKPAKANRALTVPKRSFILDPLL
ncbi:MAG: LPS translocon maturation chaperone LptM [Bosea sp. (in: a-proteobacteria)]